MGRKTSARPSPLKQSPRAAYQGPRQKSPDLTSRAGRVDRSGSDETPHGRTWSNNNTSLTSPSRDKQKEAGTAGLPGCFNRKQSIYSWHVNTFETSGPARHVEKASVSQPVGFFYMHNVYGPIFFALYIAIHTNCRPSPPHNQTDHIDPIYALEACKRGGGVPICDHETSLRVRLGDCHRHLLSCCIQYASNTSLYRSLSKPVPETCKVRLVHRLHRA